MKKFIDIQKNPEVLEPTLKKVNAIITNMESNYGQKSKAGVMLTGDPGVGKTTFAKKLGKLFGIEVIIVEAPHITEEHVINIPFISINPITGKETKKSGQIAKDENSTEFKLHLAQSNLYSLVTAKEKISDKDYLSSVYKNKTITALFENLGGDKNTIPKDVDGIRKQYNVILFLDEYYRNEAPRIQNMLRGILNNKIGLHDIPNSTYVLYASNLNDEGLTDIPQNHEFKQINFENPNKDEWFQYLVDKYEEDKNVKLNEKLIETFYDILESKNLSHADFKADVRISPRRWEQLILYINSSFPLKSDKEAKNLISNVETNFSNYKTGKKHKIYDIVITALLEFIKKESNISISEKNTNKPHEWEDSLREQIKNKMKLGHHRTYVPIVSGPPGVGKTSKIDDIAEELGLLSIYVDCSTVDTESISGIPIPQGKGENAKILFGEPTLYKQIKDEIDKKVNSLSADKKKEFNKSEWKYLIFFDEFNRVPSIQTFNSLRKVILEKEFGDDYKLPEGSIVVGAINPEDVNVIDLTSHMNDVVDIIKADASWNDTLQYLKKIKFDDKIDSRIPKVMLQAIEIFVGRFATKDRSISPEIRAYNLDVGGGATLYMSSRQYTSLYKEGVINLSKNVFKNIKQSDVDTTDKKNKLRKKMLFQIFEEFESYLDWNFNKLKIPSEPFLKPLRDWFEQNEEIDLDEFFNFMKPKIVDLSHLLKVYYEHPEEDIGQTPQLDNIILNVSPANDYLELYNLSLPFFKTLFKEQKDIAELFARTNNKGVVLHPKVLTEEYYKDSNEVDKTKLVNQITLYGVKMSTIGDLKNAVSKGVKGSESSLTSAINDIIHNLEQEWKKYKKSYFENFIMSVTKAINSIISDKPKLTNNINHRVLLEPMVDALEEEYNVSDEVKMVLHSNIPEII